MAVARQLTAQQRVSAAVALLIDGEWGLTSTTVDDQLRLLRQITVTPSVLYHPDRGPAGGERRG